MEGVDILHGDILRELDHLPDDYFDAILTDPPYGLRFMSKRWDYDVPSAAVWKELLRVLKPGAPILAFGGSRTFHRLVCAAEDAGVEVRDTLMWLYGSGFPKSLDVSKALDKAAGAEREVVGSRVLMGSAAMSTAEKGGTYSSNTSSAGRTKSIDVTTASTDLAKQWAGYGTSLKPAFEPIMLGRKPLDGTVANNATKWGVGGLAIDACRVGNAGGTAKGNPPKGKSCGIYGNGINGNCDTIELDAGRWPANIILDEEAGAMLDEQSGDRPYTLTGRADPSASYKNPSNTTPKGWLGTRNTGGSSVYADSGGASRFFYCAKTSKRERNGGVESGNNHPTVKPLALGRYLAKLILPPKREDGPRRLLVPYAGSGSEVIAARLEGWDEVTCIEREAEYVEIIKARLAHWTDDEAEEDHDKQQEKLFG